MAYNVADMRSSTHSLLKFNNCVRNLGKNFIFSSYSVLYDVEFQISIRDVPLEKGY